MGTVGTTIVVKGRKIPLKQTYDESDMKSFKGALAKVSDDAQRIRTAARVEAKSSRQSFRKYKAPKNG